MVDIILLIGLVVALVVCYLLDRRVQLKDAQLEAIPNIAVKMGDKCISYQARKEWAVGERCYIRHDGAIRFCQIRRIYLLIDLYGHREWQFVVEYFSCLGLQRVILEFNEEEFINNAFRNFADAVKKK